MSNALPDEKLPAIMLDGARTESSTGASPSKQRPPLTAISSSSITSQHTYIPPSSASSLQPTSISSPLSPPPPSFHDDETTQEIEQALARKQSRGWRRISPRAVVSPFVRKRDDGGGGEAVSLRHSEETPDRNGSIKHRRPTVSRDITFGSVKFEPVARKGTLVEGTDERALYKYAYVYENQRGFARFKALKFSSRALKLFFHYHDPPPFTKFEDEDGRRVRVDLPYNSLKDVQLPSPEWAWHGNEWLIDMAGDGITSYDGYQYNTHFDRPYGWKPIPPPWHAYLFTCCRRRRWLRLMIYLPSIVSPDSSGAYHHPSHIPEASETVSPLPAGGSSTDVKKVDKPGEDDEVSSVTPTASPNPSSPNLNVPWAKPPRSPLSHRIKVDLNDVWHNENEDWARCHTALKSMKSDGRRLELWAAWLGDRGEEEEDITGLKRLSLERRRKEERRKEKRKASAESQKKSIEKGKKRGVQWTEDNIPTESTQKGSISHFISDEPLAVDGGTAPREAVARVLREHAQEILASFVYPDSRTRFHDMLDRCGLLESLPPGLSYSITTDFRERLEM